MDSAELTFALDAARSASEEAVGWFRRGSQTERKSDGTWVTEADKAVEVALRRSIATAFPDHNILGEEEGLTAADGGEARADAPTWIVDPIDGTNNYIAGIPIWATLVGLRVEGEVQVGVCHAPMLNETYWAERGQGAYFNGERIRVSDESDLSEATVLFADAGSFADAGHGDLFDGLARGCARSRGFGDFWGHMLVARGAAHVMIETALRVWDVAALEPIVAEAGGRLTTIEGEPWSDRASCLTTNGHLHDVVMALGRSGS